MNVGTTAGDDFGDPTSPSQDQIAVRLDAYRIPRPVGGSKM